MENALTLTEFKENLRYLINNNKVRTDRGESPIAIGAEGACGIGKTEAIKQVAEELGYGYIRLNLSELEEVSDLIGFPIKEYKTVDNKWLPADVITKCCDRLEFTGEVRMSYATPS